MARSLPFALDQLQFAPERRPAFRVLVYDVKSSTVDTIGTVVANDGAVGQAIAGPRDFTDDVAVVEVTEVGGDYLSQGVASSAVVLRVEDPTGEFDPVENAAGNGRWLRAGNVVRIFEGDAQVPVQEWVTTFTGEITGQAGQDRTRVEVASFLTVKAIGREAAFLAFTSTSAEFPVLTSYLDMALEIAENDMDLDPAEIDFSAWGGTVTGQTSTYFVDESPLVSIAKIMFPDGFMPRFNGDGKLTQTTGILTAASSRIYGDDRIFLKIGRPFSDFDPPNSVCVIGLDRDLTEVVQPEQELATLSVTTGYFTENEILDVFWSDDRSILAKTVRMRVDRSVNGGMNPLGGGEKVTFIPSSDPLQVGFVGATVRIDTGFAPWLSVILTVVHIALAAIPDAVLAFGGGTTVSIGRIIQAVSLAAGMLITQKIGRGQYRFEGQPLEYVYRSIRACAQLEGVTDATRREVEVENHLVGTQAAADLIARDLLFREQAKANPRDISMLTDLSNEVDDVVERSDGRRYLLTQLRRALVRGDAAGGLASVGSYEITVGVRL